jgi:adenosylcobinamide-phosphate guanylyltransferase
MKSALLMCGGEGARMLGDVEKPLISVAGRPTVERVLQALRDSRRFGRIVAAVTPRTPATRRFLESRGVEILDTPGNGYSSDLAVALREMRPAKVFVISADMPLMSSHLVDEIVSARQVKPLLSVIMRSEFVLGLGITPSVTFNMDGSEYCHSGIILVNTSSDLGDGLIEDQEYLLMERVEIAVNVNTKKELRLAEKLLIQRA